LFLRANDKPAAGFAAGAARAVVKWRNDSRGLRAVATDDLHAPLGLKKPAAGRPIAYSVAAAVLGIATAAIVIGVAAWSRSLPTPSPAAMPAVVKPEPAAVVDVTPRVYAPGSAQSPSRQSAQQPQITGAIAPATATPEPAAPASTDRIITIIDGTSGARREIRIPATSDTAEPPLPDPGLADLMRTVPGADEAPEPPQPQPSRAKPNAPQKRAAKPGAAMSTNSPSQAPVR
jgi:hypothetical protein